jgi:hypothetical protein
MPCLEGLKARRCLGDSPTAPGIALTVAADPCDGRHNEAKGVPVATRADFEPLIDWCSQPSDFPELKRAVTVHLARLDSDDQATGYWGDHIDYGPFESRFINADFYGHVHYLTQVHFGPPHLRLWGPVLMFITLSDTEVWVGLRGSRIEPAWSDGVPITDLLSFDGGAVALRGWLRAEGISDYFRVTLFPGYRIL